MRYLRHTFVSTCISMGLSIKDIQTYGGHASRYETIDTYGNLFPDSLDKVNAQLDAFANVDNLPVLLDLVK